MNVRERIVPQLPNGYFTRQQLLKITQYAEPSFKSTQLRYLIDSLLDSNKIIRVGHNQYKRIDKNTPTRIFNGTYSQDSLRIIEYMKHQFPLLRWQMWELFWLNEFLNHLQARNQIFVEVEKEGCSFVFSALIEKFPGKVLLKPTALELERYSVDDGIIIEALISEAPKSKDSEYEVPLEKLIVDLFANKNLVFPLEDLVLAIEAMFFTYQIDQTKMFRYARRRNKAKAIHSFLTKHTNIPLII